MGECTIISWPMNWQYGRGYKPQTTVSIPYIHTQFQIPTPRQWAKAITVQNIVWLGRDKQDRERLSVFACGPRRVRCGPCDLRVVTDNDTHKLRVIHQNPPGHSQGRGQWENPEGGGDTATVVGTWGRAVRVLYKVKYKFNYAAWRPSIKWWVNCVRVKKNLFSHFG